MNMECFSIFLCSLLFHWAVVCISPWRGHLCSLLVVFPCILFSVAIVNGSSFLIWLSLSLVLAYRNACDFCTLILHPETSLKLLISFRSFWAEMMGSDILSCRLRIETIWLPPFLFEYPLFLFLAWLLWLELQVLYCVGVVREAILVYCQISKGKLPVFAHSVWYWLLVCHK